MKLSSNSQ